MWIVYTQVCTCSVGPKCSGKNGKWRYVFHCFAALGRRFILVRASKTSWLYILFFPDETLSAAWLVMEWCQFCSGAYRRLNSPAFTTLCRGGKSHSFSIYLPLNLRAVSLRNRFKWRSYFNLNSALCYYNQFITPFFPPTAWLAAVHIHTPKIT